MHSGEIGWGKKERAGDFLQKLRVLGEGRSYLEEVGGQTLSGTRSYWKTKEKGN